MPVKAYSFGTTEDKIGAEPTRTVLLIENIHGTNYLYVSDQAGMALSDGLRINPGGSLAFKKAHGEEPEKAWWIVASGAGTTTRIFVDYGDYPKIEGLVIETPTPTPPRVPI